MPLPGSRLASPSAPCSTTDWSEEGPGQLLTCIVAALHRNRGQDLLGQIGLDQRRVEMLGYLLTRRLLPSPGDELRLAHRHEIRVVGAV